MCVALQAGNGSGNLFYYYIFVGMCGRQVDFTEPAVICRFEKGVPLLLHLHHLHQGEVGGGEDPWCICQGVQGSSGGGICKFQSSGLHLYFKYEN